ncbi:MAG: insulinase family protein [Fibrobacter sp.]|jgi:zinc protease|nr:insulinase family protein [Fibrobacter sp.]HON11710.1 pitrilysin family protein [Chitinispirillaceae bacterium]
MEFRFRFPFIDEFLLKSGLRVILAPDKEQNGIVAILQLPVGKFSDPPRKEGCAELCFELVQKGSGELSSEEFSGKLEYTGASVFSEVGEEHSVLGIRMLSRNEDELFPVFWNMILSPRMEEKEFRRIGQEMATSMHAELSDPAVISSHHFYSSMAGREHPAGRFHTLDSLKNITIADVKEFHKNHFTPESCILTVAGDFDPESFKSKWLASLESWVGDGKKDVFFAPAVNESGSELRLVNKPDLTQATILLGHYAPGELYRWRNEMALANYILGAGNFSSRLMTRIRSLSGKTYGISSQLVTSKYFGAFLISTTTLSATVSEMLKMIREIYGDFCSNGITEEELERAKRFAIGNMAFQLEGICSIAEKLLWLRFYDRPNSYIEEFDAMINRISVEDVNNSIRECFSPEKLITVIVGRKKEILPQLKSSVDVRNFHFREKIG